jgi:hypothetical protein
MLLTKSKASEKIPNKVLSFLRGLSLVSAYRDDNTIRLWDAAMITPAMSVECVRAGCQQKTLRGRFIAHMFSTGWVMAVVKIIRKKKSVADQFALKYKTDTYGWTQNLNREDYGVTRSTQAPRRDSSSQGTTSGIYLSSCAYTTSFEVWCPNKVRRWKYPHG